MEYRKFSQGYVLRLDPGEEIVSSLTRLVEEEGIQLASVSALGAANDVTIGILTRWRSNTTPTGIRRITRSPPWWAM